MKEFRVWIELDKPKDTQHAKRTCQLVNNMLARLNDKPLEREFWWDEEDRVYCFGGPMGYVTCSDRGQWFNLEYLGRPLAKEG